MIKPPINQCVLFINILLGIVAGQSKPLTVGGKTEDGSGRIRLTAAGVVETAATAQQEHHEHN